MGKDEEGKRRECLKNVERKKKGYHTKKKKEEGRKEENRRGKEERKPEERRKREIQKREGKEKRSEGISFSSDEQFARRIEFQRRLPRPVTATGLRVRSSRESISFAGLGR